MTARAGVEVCLTVTLIDGLVLARSAFHHSVNYRSVTVFGRARPLTSDVDKLAALRAFTDRPYPGRSVKARSAASLSTSLVSGRARPNTVTER